MNQSLKKKETEKEIMKKKVHKDNILNQYTHTQTNIKSTFMMLHKIG